MASEFSRWFIFTKDGPQTVSGNLGGDTCRICWRFTELKNRFQLTPSGMVDICGVCYAEEHSKTASPLGLLLSLAEEKAGLAN